MSAAISQVAVPLDNGDEGIHLISTGEANTNQGLEGQLFLGTQRAAQDAVLLRRNRVSRVLCVGTPQFHPGEFSYLEIPVLDTPSANLLAHLDECMSFIEAGIRKGQNVLVNCVFAQSRSVTVVVAYLMKHRRFSLVEAMELTRAAQPTVSINPGFQAQLALYQDMNCRLTAGDGPPTVLTADATYRWFLLANALRKYGGYVPSGSAPDWLKSGENDAGPAQESPTAATGLRAKIRSYRCKACRATLFTCRNVIDHVHPVVLAASGTTYEAIAKHGDGSSWLAARDAASAASTTNAPMKSRDHKIKGQSSRNGRGRPGTTGGTCTSVFTEGLPWIGMTGADGGLSRGECSGKVICLGRNGSSCGSKLGAWSLQGTACSCGQTVKPAIQFILGRIEAV